MAWNPAHSIIRRLGGEKAVSAITKTALNAPYRWQADKGKGGAGGCIPAKHIPTLIQAAQASGVELALSDFFEPPSLVDESEAA
jgi:hypothetical protein